MHWIDRPSILYELQEKLSSADRVILQFPPTFTWLEHRRIEDQHIATWQTD